MTDDKTGREEKKNLLFADEIFAFSNRQENEK
jgi:hypothetical protein